MNEETTVNPVLTLALHVHSGLRQLAGVYDGARARDDMGFDAADTTTVHLLARKFQLSDYDVITGRRLCYKYARQLGQEFIDTLTRLDLDAPTINAPTPKLGEPVPSIDELDDPNTALNKVYPVPDPILLNPLDDSFPLTDEQESAIETITLWLDANQSNPKAEFKLGGYAGTGKTTVTKVLRTELRRKFHSVVCAFTGKAVNILQRKGVAAQTMHSLMYDVIEDADGNISFQKKTSLKDDPDLIIIDEASMISSELYADLKSFRVPLLFVGDPGQLEPVGDNPNLMAHPDLVLEQIHRQAAKSPIIRLANDVRHGRPIPRNVVSDELITKPKVIAASEYIGATQVICAKNVTRKNLNTKIRQVKGLPPNEPVENDKLICLRNNRMRGVFNGMILFVKKVLASEATYWLCDLEDEVGNKFRAEKVWKEPFVMPLVQDARVPWMHLYCDFGYVITCHKSQGSEWDHVLVVDEFMPPSVWDMKRWRYTSITRAAKKLTYCI